MSGIEDKLQDYLDGRLDGTERAELQSRIEGDPELARRVETLRELGRHLREEEAGLRPGFYTRLRSRFEEQQAPRKRGWARLLSWEAAGLTAAVGLAFALFLPGWLRNDRPDLQVSVSESKIQAPERVPPATLEPGKKKAPEVVLKESEIAEGVAEGPASETEATEPVGRKGAAEQTREIVDVGARDEAASGELNRSAGRSVAATRAPQSAPPPADGPARGDAAKPDESFRDKDAVDAVSKLSKDAPARARQDLMDARSSGRPELVVGTLDVPRPFHVAELPAGAVEQDEVRIHGTVDEWRSSQLEYRRLAAAGNFANEKTEDDAEAKAGTDAGTDAGSEDMPLRVVLLGPRDDPFACSGIEVETTDDAYRVLLARPEDRTASRTGCALFLPADGRRIDVVPNGAQR